MLAPDGRSVAFAVTTTDLPAIQRQTNIWRVDADGQNEERDDLEDDERRRNSDEAEDADGGRDGQENDHDAAETERHLAFNLVLKH